MNEEKKFRNFIKERCDIRKWRTFNKFCLFTSITVILIRMLNFLGFYNEMTSNILLCICAFLLLFIMYIEILRICLKKGALENIGGFLKRKRC